METSRINIDFKQMENAYRAHVRKKAILADSTIVYAKNGQLIEEDPKTLKITILNKDLSSVK